VERHGSMELCWCACHGSRPSDMAGSPLKTLQASEKEAGQGTGRAHPPLLRTLPCSRAPTLLPIPMPQQRLQLSHLSNSRSRCPAYAVQGRRQQTTRAPPLSRPHPLSPIPSNVRLKQQQHRPHRG